MELNELKPCPFCGGKAVLEPYKARKGYEATIQCNGGCLALMRTITYDTEEEAIEAVTNAWNKRINDELNKVYCKRYKQNHPEKIKEYAKKYRDEHNDEIKAYNKQRYEEDNTKMKERSKNYYHTKIKNNPEAMAKRREYYRKWREKRRANDGT